jgi:solute carrier family 13 (sodium-dependent dicarboxylate transporter), member 2/3/5
MSNVAAANVLLPSLACVAPHYGKSPLTILMPVTLSISMALLFPMGTPPNAIVLTNKRVNTLQLFRVGCICTIVFLATIILYCIWIMPLIVNIHHVSSTVRDVCDV